MSFTRHSSKQRPARQIVDQSDEEFDSGQDEGTASLLSPEDVAVRPKKGFLVRRYIFIIITSILMVMDIMMVIAIGVLNEKMVISNFMVALTIHSKTSFNSDNVYTAGPSVMLGGVLLSLFIMSFLLKLLQVFEML